MFQNSSFTHTNYTAQRRQLVPEPLLLPLIHRPYDFNFKMQALPKIYNGFLYCFDLESSLHCIRLQDGVEKWKVALPKNSRYPVSHQEGVPLLSNGCLINCVDETLYKIDAEDGSFESLGNFDFGVADGVFVDSLLCACWVNPDDDELEFICYSVDQKKILWQLPAPGAGNGITLVGNTVVISFSRVHLKCLDLHTGTQLWEVEFESPMQSSIIFDGSHLVVGLGNGMIIVLDHTNGQVITTSQVEGETLSLAGAGENELFLLTRENLYRLSGKNQYKPSAIPVESQLKEINCPYRCSSLSVSKTHVYFVEQFSNTICAMNIETGNIDWKVKHPNMISLLFAPRIVEGILYVCDIEGEFHAYSPVLTKNL